MTSREAILEDIRRNKPPYAPRYHWEPRLPEDGNPVTEFLRIIPQIGGRIVETVDHDLSRRLPTFYPEVSMIASAVPFYMEGTVNLRQIQDPHELKKVELFVCQGSFGVAENGAVWIDDTQMTHRVLPFITQHMAIILHQNRIVRDMHEAYELQAIDETGFGLFVAGPSKTADIEQSLVIGAHGAKSLTIFLIS